MNILLVAATTEELKPVLTHWALTDLRQPVQLGNHRIKCLITGVGMVATAFELGKHLAIHTYDLAINAGIAGSFNPDISIGQVLHITDDAFAELGAEDGEHFLSIDELGFGSSMVQPLSPNFTSTTVAGLPKAKAITVNRVHGHESSIAQTLSRLQPQLESMEGAAFFYACNRFELPALQIRAVSNQVERRNREKWNVGLAITNLNECLLRIFDELK